MAKFDVVFQGGGAKGSAFVGALQALEQRGHSTGRVIGTSAGSILAVLRAAGYNAAEMHAIVLEKLPSGVPRFSTFLDKPRRQDFTEAEVDNSVVAGLFKRAPGPVGLFADKLTEFMLDDTRFAEAFSFTECGGFYAGVAVVDWLAEKLAARGIARDTTLRQFAAQTGTDLTVVASDVTDEEMLVLNERTAPDCPVLMAVRCSMSIPFVWREMIWQASWGAYRGREKSGNAIVDGGVLSNFPIRLLMKDDDHLMGDPPNPGLPLGLLLDKTIAPPGAPDQPAKAQHHTLKTVQRVFRILETLTDAHDNQEIRDHAALICHLPVKGYGTTDFNVPDDRMALLIDGSRQAMTTYLLQREARIA